MHSTNTIHPKKTQERACRGRRLLRRVPLGSRPSPRYKTVTCMWRRPEPKPPEGRLTEATNKLLNKKGISLDKAKIRQPQSVQPKSRPLGKCRGADLPLKIGSSVVHRLILPATPLRRGHSGTMSDWPEFCLYPKSRSLAMDAEKMPRQSIGSYLMKKFRCEIHPSLFSFEPLLCCHPRH